MRLYHILKSEPAIPHNYPTGAASAFAVMPLPQFSQFQTAPFQGRCLRGKRLSFQLNSQQFLLSRRQYFLTAVILCFFTDTSLPQAQHPYRDKCLDNHHALKVIPGLHSQRFHTCTITFPRFVVFLYQPVSLVMADDTSRIGGTRHFF